MTGLVAKSAENADVRGGEQRWSGAEITAVLERADNAEAALIEEYQLLRRSWEANPTMSAMKDGIVAIRALRKVALSTGSVAA